MSTPPVVEAEGLGRRFGGRAVLQDVTLRVGAGEVFGVVGPDGAGKTTLLQMLAAILRPSLGTCGVLGEDVRKHPERVQAQVGYMSQGFSLYDRLTVAENIAFAAGIRDVPQAAFAARKSKLVAMAGLERFQDRREGALSGGMRKKLALCANLIHEPPLLILDEPSLGVDPLSRRELWRILDAARKDGRSIVFATSYMDEADASDRVLLLRDGRPLALGAPSELRETARAHVFSVRTDTPAAAEAALHDAAVLSELLGAHSDHVLRQHLPRDRDAWGGARRALGQRRRPHGLHRRRAVAGDRAAQEADRLNAGRPSLRPVGQGVRADAARPGGAVPDLLADHG